MSRLTLPFSGPTPVIPVEGPLPVGALRKVLLGLQVVLFPVFPNTQTGQHIHWPIHFAYRNGLLIAWVASDLTGK